MADPFRKFARRPSNAMDMPWALAGAAGVVLVWTLSGLAFGFSESWQLFINTGTAIVTFLMVFIIFNTQNHDSRALHLKLDELIDAIGNARNELLAIEDAPDAELTRRAKEFVRFREEAMARADN